MRRFKCGCEFSDSNRWVDGDSAINRLGSPGLKPGLQGQFASAAGERWALGHPGSDTGEGVGMSCRVQELSLGRTQGLMVARIQVAGEGIRGDCRRVGGVNIS